MPNLVTTFIKNQDRLGSTELFKYRGASSYGTEIGGSMTLLVKTFFVILTSI